jgi:hypothetical protein
MKKNENTNLRRDDGAREYRALAERMNAVSLEAMKVARELTQMADNAERKAA